MRALYVFRKALREARRDVMVVLLSVVFAPLFVVLYYVAFPASLATYRVALVDRDEGAALADGTRLRAGSDIAAALAASRDASGHQVLAVTRVDSEREAVRRVERREASAIVVLGADLSRSLVAMRDAPISTARATLTLRGDLTSPGYSVASVLAAATIDGYVRQVTGRTGPLDLVEQPLGASAARTDFEVYVPGIMVFAVVMLIFLAAMTVARESESGAIRRLRLTRMTSFDFLAGTSGMLVLVALVAVLMTFATALGLGFRSQGPLWLAVVVVVITAMSVIGVGMMVAAWARTVTQAFVIANLPLGLLMFFTGAMFPIPHATLFRLAGHGIGPFDLLPPTHAVAALNKIFTMGAGLSGIAFELVALVVLTAAYFAVGTGLLYRLRLRPA